LRGVLALEDAGLASLAEILARQHWETWLVSLHVVLRGDEALQEVAGDDIYWKRRLSEALKLGRDYHPDWSGKIVKLNFKSLSDRLPKLLLNAGESVDAHGVSGYDVTYSVQSLFAVHANMVTIAAHIVYVPDAWRVIPNPQAPFPDVALTPVLHTVHLAQYVFKEFSLSTGPLDPLWTALLNSQQPASNVAAAASNTPLPPTSGAGAPD
jgi:hypothetical protein